LNRPIGIFLLLWPTLWAIWIASEGQPNIPILIIFVLGVVLMRSAGCAINDFADREIDPHVSRTQQRPIAAGAINAHEALIVFLVLALAAFILVLQLNWLTIQFSLVAVVLAASYPFMKRFHHMPQIHLGAAFGWAVPMAFTAHTGEFPPPVAWLIFMATLLWTTAYDTMYAMADREDDLKIGVKSSAILFGEQDRLFIAFLQGLFFLAMVFAGQQSGMGWPYYAGLIAAGGFALYQQWLILERDPAQCFRAFLNNNWLGMTILLGIIVDYALR
jgi:4-hydroxybenzoate polyprenyltransferase